MILITRSTVSLCSNTVLDILTNAVGAVYLI